MPELFLYGHGSLHYGGGYDIVGDSADEHRKEKREALRGWIRNLGLQVDLLEGGAAVGWFWVRHERSAGRFLGRVGLRRDPQGRSLMEVRALLLSQEECRQIAWNPFQAAGLFDVAPLWEPGGDGRLHRMSQWPTTEAGPAGDHLAAAFSRLVELSSVRERKDLTFAGPLTHRIAGITHQFAGPARKDFRQWPASFLRAGVVAALVIVGWLAGAGSYRWLAPGPDPKDARAVVAPAPESPARPAAVEAEDIQQDVARRLARLAGDLIVFIGSLYPDLPASGRQEPAWSERGIDPIIQRLEAVELSTDPTWQIQELSTAVSLWAKRERSYAIVRHGFEDAVRAVDNLDTALARLDSNSTQFRAREAEFPEDRLGQIDELISALRDLIEQLHDP